MQIIIYVFSVSYDNPFSVCRVLDREGLFGTSTYVCTVPMIALHLKFNNDNNNNNNNNNNNYYYYYYYYYYYSTFFWVH